MDTSKKHEAHAALTPVKTEAQVTVYRHADGCCHLWAPTDATQAGHPGQKVADIRCSVDEIPAVLAKFSDICTAKALAAA